MKPKAVFIIPYFGTLPEWFPLYLLSVGAQPDFSWRLYLDDRRPFDYPPNVDVTYMSFAAYKSLMAEKLEIPLRGLDVFEPYLLCDLKPFLGYLHEADIESFDYWGFADIDLIVGDLGRFVMPSMKRGTDVISSHEDRIAGHMTVIRNTATLRRRCLDIPDWNRHLQSGLHPSLCEYHFTEEVFPLYRRIGWWRGRQAYSLMRRLGIQRLFGRRRYCEEMYSTPLTDIPWTDGSLFWDQPLEWEWREGRVTSLLSGQEVPYIHFMNYKGSRYLTENLRRAIDKKGYVPDPPEGQDQERAPWEDLDSVLLNPDHRGEVRWIRVSLRGIGVG